MSCVFQAGPCYSNPQKNQPITSIINASLEQSKCPKFFKQAHVTPILKKSSLGLDNSFLTSQSIILVIKANLKLFISIQPLRVMTGPYFQSLREMTKNFSHYV